MPPSTTTKITVAHDEIRHWAEQRGAQPVVAVDGKVDDDPGLVRLECPGDQDAGLLKPISWVEWFRKFDDSKLALLYQEETPAGERSNFNKFVSRKAADEVEQALGGKGRSAVRRKSSKQARPPVASRALRGESPSEAKKDKRAHTTRPKQLAHRSEVSARLGSTRKKGMPIA